MSRTFTIPIQYGPNGCQVNIGGNQTCRETQTLEIIKEFNRVYESKLHELNNIGCGDNLLAKVHLQQDWIRDLTQQNELLVRAVEELEKEAAERVSMLEERLQNGAQANEDVQKLDTKLKEMQKQLNHSPKETELEELNFKLHLKDEELGSLKRSMLGVRDSLLVEVCEKHDAVVSLKHDVQMLEERCRIADEKIKYKDKQIKELVQQLDLLKAKCLENGGSKKSVERQSLDKDASIKSLSHEVKKLDQLCQEECHKSFAKDKIIKDLNKELCLLKDRITKLENKKSLKQSSSPGKRSSNSPPRSTSPRPKSPSQKKKKHVVQSQNCPLPNPTSACLCNFQQSQSLGKSTHSKCFCHESNCSRKGEPHFTSIGECSLCFCPESNCSEDVVMYAMGDYKPSPLSPSLLNVLEDEEVETVALPKKRVIPSNISKNKSNNSPYVYLYESDVRHNTNNTFEETFVHKNSEENIIFTSENCFYSSNTNMTTASKTNIKRVSEESCTLTVNKNLHESYGILDSSGSHGVIKSVQEVTKMNLLNVPKRVPVKTRVNNLELNIKKNGEACIGIKKRIQSPTAAKNK